MSQPPPYNRQASFTNLQALNPAGQPPGNLMDAEYNAIKTTLDAIDANLVLIQKDDGTLANQSVGPEQLSSEFLLGFTPPRPWATATSYSSSPASTVLHGTGLYICLVSHTSGNFNTDLGAGRWLLVVDLSTIPILTASQIGVTPDAGLVTSDVQTSLNAIDAGKAALSHTHPSSQISDSTAAGRAMLVAANVAAQQTLLGLGALAYLNTAPAVTNISAQLGFTGRISSTVPATTNDFTPTGWASNAVLQVTAALSFTITGFGATTDGDVKFVQNVSTFPMTLIPNSASSAAANRIGGPRPVVVGPGQAVLLQYDSVNTLWRIMSPIGGEPVRGSLRNLRVGNVANFLGDSAPGTPNSQAYINVDEIVLEDTNARPWTVSTVALIADATVVGANGIDAGSLANTTWYSLWVIGNPLTNTVAGLIGTSATAPTLPSGYTFKARVGWMRTDGSAHFLKTLQYGKTARYAAVAALPSMTTGSSTTTVAVANFVPTTAVKIALVLRSEGATTGAVSIAPNNTITAPPLRWAINANGGNDVIGEFMLEGSNVYYVSSGGASTGLDAYGWEDS